MYILLYTKSLVYIYIRIYIYTCIYIYTYIYICRYMHIFSDRTKHPSSYGAPVSASVTTPQSVKQWRRRPQEDDIVSPKKIEKLDEVEGT